MKWDSTIRETSSVESVVHPHCEEERADLFRTFQAGSVEHEVLDMLYALVRLVKPENILETGTQYGYSAIALGLAARDNGFGKVRSIERDAACAQRARELVRTVGLDGTVDVVTEESVEYVEAGALDGMRFDVALFDSSTPSRPREFWKLYERGCLGEIVVFHDTSRLREQSLVVPGEPQGTYLSALDAIQHEAGSGTLEFGLSRGLRLIQLNRIRNPAYTRT